MLAQPELNLVGPYFTVSLSLELLLLERPVSLGRNQISSSCVCVYVCVVPATGFEARAHLSSPCELR